MMILRARRKRVVNSSQFARPFRGLAIGTLFNRRLTSSWLEDGHCRSWQSNQYWSESFRNMDGWSRRFVNPGEQTLLDELHRFVDLAQWAAWNVFNRQEDDFFNGG